jgi:hypothetical protein
VQVKNHPSLYNARAVEVMLRMGELLYIPSYWLHYIVSQDASIQCNCRSGESTIGRSSVDQCGYGKDRRSATKNRHGED